MKPRRIAKGERVAAGLVLIREVAGLPKGRILSEADVRALESAGWPAVEAVELEPGDVHEDAAGQRLARAVAGEGVEPGPVEGGSYPIIARKRGLLEVDVSRLAALNQIIDVAVNTHPPQYVAVEGNVVARVKVIPFVTREERVRHAEGVAEGGVVRIRPFASLRGSLLVHETIADAALQRARQAFEAKLEFFGSKLATARAVPGDPESLARALREERHNGAQLVVLAGSRSMDPEDPVLRALELAGARMERHGVPAYPGTLLWIAYLGNVPVLGAPSCGIFSRATSLDLVLPRLMTGERLRVEDIAALAAGGIVAPETSYRLAPYRAGVPRGQLE
jgi:hypothetical protein